MEKTFMRAKIARLETANAALRQQLDYLAGTVEVLAKSEAALKTELAAVREELHTKTQLLVDISYEARCTDCMLLPVAIADLQGKLAEAQARVRELEGKA